jgi:hypothetical protein
MFTYLNEVITILKREHCFDHLDQEKKQNLIEEIVKLARYEDDCNPGEILEGHTDYFKICYCCLAKTSVPHTPFQVSMGFSATPL